MATRAANLERNQNVIIQAALAQLRELFTWESFMTAALEHLQARGWRPLRRGGAFFVAREGTVVTFVEAVVHEARAWFQLDGAAHIPLVAPPAAKVGKKRKTSAKRKRGAK